MSKRSKGNVQEESRGDQGDRHDAAPDALQHDSGTQPSSSDEEKALAPRDIAMIASIAASLIVQEALRNPQMIEMLRQQHAGDRDLEMFAVLDESPDLPADAIIKFLKRPDMPSEAVEAYKATYAGMQPWVKDQARLEAERQAAARIQRASRYEKAGREDPVGAKIVDQAEKDRIARNQPGLAIGEIGDDGDNADARVTA